MTNSTSLAFPIIALGLLITSCREFKLEVELPEPVEPTTVEAGEYSIRQHITLMKDDEELYSKELDIDLRRTQLSNKVEWMVGNVTLGSGIRVSGFHLAEIPFNVQYYYVDSFLNFEVYQEVVVSENSITFYQDENPSNRSYKGFEAFTNWHQDTLPEKKDTLKVGFGKFDSTDPPFGHIILKYHFESRGAELVLMGQEFENSESLKALKEILGSDSYFLNAKTAVPKSITTLRPNSTITPLASPIPE